MSVTKIVNISTSSSGTNTLVGLNDTNITLPSSGDTILFDGTNFINSTIKNQIFTAANGQLSYTLSMPASLATAHDLRVYRNGVRLPNTLYANLDKTTVTLNTISPNAGDIIEMYYY